MSSFQTKRDWKWTNNSSYYKKLRLDLFINDPTADDYEKMKNDYRCWKRYKKHQWRN